MKSFRAYIIENSQVTKAFEAAKKNANYIKSENYKKRYLESLDSLMAAAENKEVYNARFNEYKGKLSSGIEYSYQGMFDEIKDDLINQNQETSDLWSIYTINDIKKKAKLYDSMKPRNTKAVEFMNNIRDLPDAMKQMKSYVKSGKEPKTPNLNQFIKPVSSPEANKLATKFMKDASETFKKNLEKDITKGMKSAYKKIVDITDPKDLPRDSNSITVASTIFMTKGYGKNKTLEVIPNSEKRIDKLIADTVENIVDKFIYKNVSKLSLILQKKDKPKSHSIIRTNVKNGLVENLMKFDFTDGSSFIMESTVIYKTSSQGKFFTQYPTRFKNVVLADGSKMKMPSEEKMIKEF